LGHNTNSIEAVHAALDQGANAVEIDVTAYAHDLNALCIDHAGLMGDDPGRASAPAFEPFLRELRQVVDRRPELCMVEFDLKPPASRPELGPVRSGAIRDILTRETTLSVILSVADVTTSHADRPRGSSVFDRIHGGAQARVAPRRSRARLPRACGRFRRSRSRPCAPCSWTSCAGVCPQPRSRVPALRRTG
jgi:hypothetical protein